MRKNSIMILCLISVLLIQSVIVVSILPSNERVQIVQNRNMNNHTNEKAVESYSDLLKTNVIRNPSFEELSAEGQPLYFSAYGTEYSLYNSTYQDIVHNGAYSGYIEGHASSMANAYPSIRQYFSDSDSFINESLTANLYYYIKDPGALDKNSMFQIYFETTNSSNVYFSFIYIVCYGSYSASNSTYTTYFMMNSSIGVWNLFSRNLTQDFYSVYSYLPFDSSRRITSIWLQTYAQIYSNELNSMVIDDVSIQNGTGYELIENGDFESGTGSPWYGSYRSPAELTTSSDTADGNNAANITIRSSGQYHTGFANLYRVTYQPYLQIYPTSPYSAILEFDWKYKDIYNGGGQYAYVRVQFANSSGSVWLYYMLGSDLDEIYFTNSSGSVYLKAPDFGIRNQWNRFTCDLTKAMLDNNFNNMSIREVRFYLNLGSFANSSVNLLIDNMKLYTYTFGDPSFEGNCQDSASGNINSWVTSVYDTSRISRSSDAHSGQYSLNLTSVNSEWISVERYDHTQIQPEYFFDFSWKINKLNIEASMLSIAEITLSLEGGYSLHYVVAASPASNLINNTYNVFYFVDDFNITDSWITTHRNITHDLNVSFGEHKWNVTGIELIASTEAGYNMTVLFDDIGFVEEIPPEITGISLDPTQPMYYQSAALSLDVIDNQPYNIKQVSVYYRTTGSWTSIEAIESNSYQAIIPAQPYGQTVEYYVQAIDWCGNIAIDDNGGAYYSYSVGDDIVPTVSFDHPDTGIVVVGEVLLNATADDEGSGIDHVEFIVEGTSVYNDSSEPYEFLWNSRTVGNGTRTLIVRAYDVAGLTAEDYITVDVQNDVAPPELTELIMSPEEPQYGQAVTISVGAIDVNGVKNITLFYRVNDGTWTSMLMTQNGILYRSVIPAQSYGSTVEYYIVAYDVFGTYDSIGNESDPLSYFVDDFTLPILTVSGPSIHEPVRDVVTFYVTAEDEGSGVSSIEFRVNGEPVSSTSGNTIAWNTLDFTNGNYTLTFTAIDNAGNSIVITMEYQVHNPVGVEVITDILSSALAQYGFFIGAGTVIAIIIIAKIFVRRRSK